MNGMRMLIGLLSLAVTALGAGTAWVGNILVNRLESVQIMLHADRKVYEHRLTALETALDRCLNPEST